MDETQTLAVLALREPLDNPDRNDWDGLRAANRALIKAFINRTEIRFRAWAKRTPGGTGIAPTARRPDRTDWDELIAAKRALIKRRDRHGHDASRCLRGHWATTHGIGP